MMYNDNLIQWLWLYGAVVIFILLSTFQRRVPSVGLPLAYAFNLSMNHYFGALIYSLPWYGGSDYQYVYLGFEQTLYGIAAFAVGSSVVGNFLIINFLWREDCHLVKPNPTLPWRYLQIGLVAYLLMGPILGRIPSIATFAQSGWYLLITAVCLLSWQAWGQRKIHKLAMWIVVTLAFPFFTSFNSGFLGYGVVALMSIMFFIASFFKPRWLVVIGIFIGIYLGLSLCVTYFRDRDELREAVWYDRQSIDARIGRVFQTLADFEFLDLTQEAHLKRIDGRLNQNVLVGMSIVFLQENPNKFGRGDTLLNSVFALVPRILWPSKPVNAGDPKIVTRFTGLTFAEGTSVGAGQVLEFYVNFGTPCVIIGFMILGAVIRYFDYRAAQNLGRGDWQQFALWFLPALGFMQAGGSLMEVTSTVGAATVFCILVSRYLTKDLEGKKFVMMRRENRQ